MLPAPVVLPGVTLDPVKAEACGFNGSGFSMVRMQTPRGERIRLLQPGNDDFTSLPDGRFILGRQGIAYLTFIIEDLAGKIASLREAGVEMISSDAPFITRPGTAIAFCRDPEGNILEFVEYEDIDTRGEPTADLRSNIAAEARAKIVYERLINITDDPGIKDALAFLMTREVAHQKFFEKALYAIENNMPLGKLPAIEKYANMYVNTSQGEGDRNAPFPWE